LSFIKVIARQIANALNYMNILGIIHCDLKPENILLKSRHQTAIKIIDFGTALYEKQIYYTYIQSRYYRAPEVMLGIPYTCAIDMWGFGCILVELYNGFPIFTGEDEAEQLAIIMEYKGVPPAKMILVIM
jgi:dual specificity tyrosine-phosphorylation-regulated kinase 2/3/4